MPEADLGGWQGHGRLCKLGFQLVEDRGTEAHGWVAHHAGHLSAAGIPASPHLINCCKFQDDSRAWDTDQLVLIRFHLFVLWYKHFSNHLG